MRGSQEGEIRCRTISSRGVAVRQEIARRGSWCRISMLSVEILTEKQDVCVVCMVLWGYVEAELHQRNTFILVYKQLDLSRRLPTACNYPPVSTNTCACQIRNLARPGTGRVDNACLRLLDHILLRRTATKLLVHSHWRTEV